MQDSALINLVIKGNDHAFRMLIEQYRSFIFQTTYGILRNEKDAEDATQEVFIKVYNSLSKYEGKGLKTWLARIAVNHAIDVKRKKTRRQEDVTEDVSLEFVSASLDTVEGQYMRKELQYSVRRKINDIPENYRRVVFGYYIEEKSFKELAIEQGINEKSVRVKLHRARNWMREHWKEDDFS